jgi:membrane protease YdiL (CAAX protease family)
MNLENINSNSLNENKSESICQLLSVKNFIIGIAIIWGVELFLGILLGIFLVITGGSPKELNVLPLFVIGLLSTAVTFGVCWYFLCEKYKISIFKGFCLHRPNTRVIIGSVIIGLAGSLIAAFLSSKYGTGNSFLAKLTETYTGLVTLIIMAIIFPPFEEIYYRGFIFPFLQKKLGSVIAISIVIIWFGVVHVSQLAGDWIGVPIIVAMGAIWTIQRHIHKSLVPSIITHWIYNIVLVLIALMQI